MIDPITHLLHSQAGQHGPVILMYHSIMAGKGKPTWPWATSLERFTAHLDFLAAEGWATPTLGELMAAPGRWRGRVAAITFDDGYVDNLAAFEALRRRGMRATWFIVSGSIGRAPAWPADGRPGGRLLGASELRDMHACGMEIGSHTHNHVRLTEVDDACMASELAVSKATIEDILGAEVAGFAYPYGDWDERCESAVERAGYRHASTTRTGWALRDGKPYRLRRLTIVNSDTSGSLARKLTSGSNDVSWPFMTRHVWHRFLMSRVLRDQ
jgi:peptidoglycan/xylan/chitin deacetylase (PgdA/CDA1 family)